MGAVHSAALSECLVVVSGRVRRQDFNSGHVVVVAL